jgi:ribosomal protein S25
MVLCVGDSPLKLFDIIERVTRKIAPGPAPAFNEAHVVKALEMIDKYQTVGRIKLSKEMGLGEGTTRTLLKHLKNTPRL